MGILDVFRGKKKGGVEDSQLPLPPESLKFTGSVGEIREQVKTGAYRTAFSPELEEQDKERAEFHQKMEKYYTAMKACFKKLRISTEGAPSWEAVKKGLNSEVLQKSVHLGKPTLILVPPGDFESKLKAYCQYGGGEAMWDRMKNRELWFGGVKEDPAEWRVFVVDGKLNIDADPEIVRDRALAKRGAHPETDNFRMCKVWVRKNAELGLDVVNDVQVYFPLFLRSQLEGKPIDEKSCTVLNGKNVQSLPPADSGNFGSGQVAFGFFRHFTFHFDTRNQREY